MPRRHRSHSTEFKRQTLAEKRAYISGRRPAGLSIERGCELMGIARSS